MSYIVSDARRRDVLHCAWNLEGRGYRGGRTTISNRSWTKFQITNFRDQRQYLRFYYGYLGNLIVLSQRVYPECAVEDTGYHVYQGKP